jgi:hypothetical protein
MSGLLGVALRHHARDLHLALAVPLLPTVENDESMMTLAEGLAWSIGGTVTMHGLDPNHPTIRSAIESFVQLVLAEHDRTQSS